MRILIAITGASGLEYGRRLIEVLKKIKKLHISVVVSEGAKKVAKAVVKATGADGFNIGQNNGKAAGQAVMHFHLHIIPRFEGDGLQHWPGKSYEEGEMDKVAEKIKSLL